MSFSRRARNPENFTPQYTEYTACGSPTAITIPAASPGDIFLDTLDNQIWYFSMEWKLWTSLLVDHHHPTISGRFLCPTAEMFIWAHQSTFCHARMEYVRLFGKKFDAAAIINKYTSHQLLPPASAPLLALRLHIYH
jgi:hypothetical protein